MGVDLQVVEAMGEERWGGNMRGSLDLLREILLFSSMMMIDDDAVDGDLYFFTI